MRIIIMIDTLRLNKTFLHFLQSFVTTFRLIKQFTEKSYFKTDGINFCMIVRPTVSSIIK